MSFFQFSLKTKSILSSILCFHILDNGMLFCFEHFFYFLGLLIFSDSKFSHKSSMVVLVSASFLNGQYLFE